MFFFSFLCRVLSKCVIFICFVFVGCSFLNISILCLISNFFNLGIILGEFRYCDLIFIFELISLFSGDILNDIFLFCFI